MSRSIAYISVRSHCEGAARSGSMEALRRRLGRLCYPLDFPELVIVGGHIGYPWTDEAVAVATKHENVYVDTSAYTVRRYPPALLDYIRSHGVTKVLFGTNCPMIAPEKALEGLEALGLTEEIKAAFLGGNAARVFRL